MGVNLETLRPEPTVEGYTTPGGYSSKAVRPIALRMCMEIATLIRREFPGRTLSGMGGIENGGDAAQFILLGSDTVQVCTGVMKFGYECVKPMCEELLAFMEKHGFETLADFRGKSLDYFTTHAELVRMQSERKTAQKAAARNRRRWSSPTGNGTATASCSSPTRWLAVEGSSADFSNDDPLPKPHRRRMAHPRRRGRRARLQSLARGGHRRDPALRRRDGQ